MFKKNLFAVAILILLIAGYFFFNHKETATQSGSTADAERISSSEKFNPDFVKTSLPVQQTITDSIPITGKL